MRKILLSSLMILLAIGLVVSCQQTTKQSTAPEKNTGTPEVQKPANHEEQCPMKKMGLSCAGDGKTCPADEGKGPCDECKDKAEQVKEAELAKLWDKAVAQLNAKEYAQALETLYQADKVDPSNPNIQTSIAYVFAMKGDYDKALVIYNRLLEKNPGNPEFLAGIANVYTIKGDYDKALEIYNDMLKTLPNNPNILGCIANVYSTKGDYDKALETYQRMLKTMPGDNVVLYNIACIYSLKGDKKDACDCLQKAVQSGYYDWEYMGKDKDLDNIRSEEAYKKLIDALKLVHPVMQSDSECTGACTGNCPNEADHTHPHATTAPDGHKHMHEWCDQCPDHDKCLKDGKCAGDCEKKKKDIDDKNKKCTGDCDKKDNK